MNRRTAIAVGAVVAVGATAFAAVDLAICWGLKKFGEAAVEFSNAVDEAIEAMNR